MPHPSDDGGFGTLLNRNSLCTGDGAASDWRGMIGNHLGEPLGKIGMAGMRGEEAHHGSREVFDVNLLGLLPSLGVGFFAFCKTLGGSLGFEFALNSFNGRSRCPHAF